MSLVAGWPAAASWAILACTPCMSGPGVNVALRLRTYFLLTAAIISLKAGAPPKLVADQVALTLDSFLAPSISWSSADEALALGLDAGGAGEEVGVVPPQAASSNASHTVVQILGHSPSLLHCGGSGINLGIRSLLS